MAGACLDSLVDETIDSLCERVKKRQHCKIPKGCKHMIKPTDGCCPVCGKPHMKLPCYVVRHLYLGPQGSAVSIAIDEDGLSQLAEVGGYEITQDALMEAVLANVIMSNKSEELLDKCEIEGYVTSTGRINNITL